MTNLDDDLSRRYARALEQYTSLSRAFVKQRAPHPEPAAAADRTREFTDTLSRWFQASIAGEPTDFSQERISRRMFELAAECQRLQAQLARHWASVGQAAATAFALQLSAPPAAAGEDWARHVYSQWIDAAEKAYTDAAHGADYADLIARLTNALHAFKAEQASLLEMWARQFNQPTRSEVDALALQIKDLREQVRDLRRRLGP